MNLSTTILVAPFLEWQSGDVGLVSAQHGSNITFMCLVSGQPTPTVTWLKDGKPLESADENFSIQKTNITGFSKPGRISLNSTLTMFGLTVGNNGYYSCRAENRLGMVDIEGYTLSVTDPITPGKQLK